MVKACLQFSPAIFLARKTVDEEVQIIAKHQQEVVLSHYVTLRTVYIPVPRGAKFYQGFPIIPPHQDGAGFQTCGMGRSFDRLTMNILMKLWNYFKNGTLFLFILSSYFY